MKTVEAIIEPSGEICLIEPISVSTSTRALVTILEEVSILGETSGVHGTARLSETALAEDWNRPEEDAAWAHLQLGKSS